jgi:hypothetical protein
LAEAGEQIAGLQFFTFGGIGRTADWMRRYGSSENSGDGRQARH